MFHWILQTNAKSNDSRKFLLFFCIGDLALFYILTFGLTHTSTSSPPYPLLIRTRSSIIHTSSLLTCWKKYSLIREPTLSTKIRPKRDQKVPRKWPKSNQKCQKKDQKDGRPRSKIWQNVTKVWPKMFKCWLYHAHFSHLVKWCFQEIRSTPPSFLWVTHIILWNDLAVVLQVQ